VQGAAPLLPPLASPLTTNKPPPTHTYTHSQEHTNAKTDIILLLEDEKNEAEAEGLALPEDVEEDEAARPQGRAFCAVM
jgi:hypothetical protein